MRALILKELERKHVDNHLRFWKDLEQIQFVEENHISYNEFLVELRKMIEEGVLSVVSGKNEKLGFVDVYWNNQP